MKRRLAIAIIMAGILAAGCTVSAGQNYDTVTAQLSPQFTIVVDGTERDFYNAEGTEVHPIVYDGTTYLPLRAIGELMDRNVNWDEQTLTVTLSGTRDGNVVSGTPDSSAVSEEVSAQLRYDFTIVADGAKQTFTDSNGNRVYPLLYNGSTYLPIRAIGGLMGKTVNWDAETETITLSVPSQSTDTTVTDADSFNSSTAANQTDGKSDNAPGNQTGGKSDSTSGNQTGGRKDNAPGNQTGGKNENNNSAYDHNIDSSLAAITADEAKQIALVNAGLTESEVQFTKIKLDYEDGVLVYDVEFYSGRTEYEYEINASTGAIVDIDIDIDK